NVSALSKQSSALARQSSADIKFTASPSGMHKATPPCQSLDTRQSSLSGARSRSESPLRWANAIGGAIVLHGRHVKLATQSENGRRPAQAQILSIADQQRWVSKTTRALGVSRDQNEGSAPSSIDCIRAMGSQLTYRSNMPTKKKKIRARDCNDEAAN